MLCLYIWFHYARLQGYKYNSFSYIINKITGSQCQAHSCMNVVILDDFLPLAMSFQCLTLESSINLLSSQAAFSCKIRNYSQAKAFWIPVSEHWDDTIVCTAGLKTQRSYSCVSSTGMTPFRRQLA
ncbi:MAG: hypothetical protein PG981_001256 [Wolbachia endosymbiont of Ctenocephalides orientis wCori]|nr:MAG: hypothetical protein PG981_001256 [Wolbachia endosymbiont of Ctenocephalides orientis wCori]